MDKNDEKMVVRLVALTDYLKSDGECLGNVGSIRLEANSLSRKLLYSSRAKDDKRLRVMTDYLVKGTSYTELARRYVYSREGIKQIIRCHRLKAKNLYPNLYPSKPLQ